MNLAVFEIFPCLLRAVQSKIKGLKETINSLRFTWINVS